MEEVVPPPVFPFSLYLVPFDFIVYFSVFPSPVLFIMRTGPQAKERERVEPFFAFLFFPLSDTESGMLPRAILALSFRYPCAVLALFLIPRAVCY